MPDIKAALSGAGFTVTPLAAAGEGMPKPFPGHLEARLKEDATANKHVAAILTNVMHADLRSARAAQLAYQREGESILIPVTTQAERRIVDQLTDNLVRQERAALLEIVEQWARVYEVPDAEVYQLTQLVTRVRGPVTSDIVDNTATGQYEEEADGECGDFLPFRGTTAQRRRKFPSSELALAE
jgi:hypothetical protein